MSNFVKNKIFINKAKYSSNATFLDFKKIKIHYFWGYIDTSSFTSVKNC